MWLYCLKAKKTSDFFHRNDSSHKYNLVLIVLFSYMHLIWLRQWEKQNKIGRLYLRLNENNNNNNTNNVERDFHHIITEWKLNSIFNWGKFCMCLRDNFCQLIQNGISVEYLSSWFRATLHIITWSERQRINIDMNFEMTGNNVKQKKLATHSSQCVTYRRFSFGLARFSSTILFGSSLLIDVCDLLSIKHIVSGDVFFSQKFLCSQHLNDSLLSLALLSLVSRFCS